MAVFNIRKLIRTVAVKRRSVEIAIKTLDSKREKLSKDETDLRNRERELRSLYEEAYRRKILGKLLTKRAWREFARNWEDEKVANFRF